MATTSDSQRAVCVCAKQISDLESEVDYLSGSQTVSDVVALPSSSLLLGESLCSYQPQEELGLGFGLTSEDLREDEDHSKQNFLLGGGVDK